MTAGSISVYPDDPISKLKDRMATSGWVFRFDLDSNDHIGIVTRTDLISTLNHDEMPTQAEIAEMLLGRAATSA